MTTFFTIDRANARLPEVRDLLLRLRSQRDELIGLRDRFVALGGVDGTDPGSSGPLETSLETPVERPGERPARAPDAAEDVSTLTGLEQTELLRLRMKGIIDQMGASVARIDAWGITLRDIGTGLIDFPALVGGRPIWLCWRLGEEDVDWWHELDSGFSARRRLADLGGVAELE